MAEKKYLDLTGLTRYDTKIKSYIADYLKNIAGYNASKSQVLSNRVGTLVWKDSTDTEALLLYKVILNDNGGAASIEAKGTPSFYNIATTNEGMYMANDDLGKSYYFRGAIPNNYVSFAGRIWRIVRINGDNTVRLIGNVDTSWGKTKYNNSLNDNMYVGYKYTSGEVHGLGTDSVIKTSLENWYTNKLQSYDNYIADQIFINDRRPYTDAQGTTSGGGTGTTETYYGSYVRNNYSRQPKIPSLTTDVAEDRFSVGSTIGSVQTNGACSKKIGLLTVDEYVMAGGGENVWNDDFYLKIGQYWWLGSPRMFMSVGIAQCFTQGQHGGLEAISPNSSYYFRPVISLKADVKIKGGTGTQTDPYIIDVSN